MFRIICRRLHSVAKDITADLSNVNITKDNIWIENSSGYTPIELACKYHNHIFLQHVKTVLQSTIVKQPYKGRIVSIQDVDPDASSLIGFVSDFYEI